jgi:ribosomal protein S18 acetylase RimI-like enzyme
VPATVDDVAAVLAFWAVAAENASRPADAASAVRGLVARDPEALLLATADGVLVGTVIAGWDGWRAHVYRLAVHPDHRGRGLARRLLGAVEERFAALGAGRADAMVLDENTGAQRTWHAAGYDRQAEWSRWVKPLG